MIPFCVHQQLAPLAGFPQQQGAGGIEEYIHRIGRAGRSESAEGLAITFFTEADSESAWELTKILRLAGQQVPAPLLKLGERGEETEARAESERKQAKREAKKAKKKRAKERREGDWICAACGASVFASKAACFKCGAAKPAAAGGGASA